MITVIHAGAHLEFPQYRFEKAQTQYHLADLDVWI